MSIESETSDLGCADAEVDPANGYLVQIDGRGITRDVICLSRDSSTLIGRSSHCDLQIEQLQCSRKHARIWSSQGVWFIEDLGSANGTWVAGRRVEIASLKSGDDVRLGNVPFRFLCNADPELEFHQSVAKLADAVGLSRLHPAESSLQPASKTGASTERRKPRAEVFGQLDTRAS